MLKKRTGVFETNSSSLHSVSISHDFKGLIDTSLIPNSEGVLTIQAQGFGRQWYRFNDARTKAAYCLQKYAGSLNLKLYERLVRVIKARTLAKEVVLNNSTDSWFDDSGKSVTPKLMRDMDAFIFNPKSWLFLGNDESSAPPEYYIPLGTPLKWKLLLPEHPGVYVRFPNYPTNDEFSEALWSLDLTIYKPYESLELHHSGFKPRKDREEAKYKLLRFTNEAYDDTMLNFEIDNEYELARKELEAEGIAQTKEMKWEEWSEIRKVKEREIMNRPTSKVSIPYRLIEINEVA